MGSKRAVVKANFRTFLWRWPNLLVERPMELTPKRALSCATTKRGTLQPVPAGRLGDGNGTSTAIVESEPGVRQVQPRCVHQGRTRASRLCGWRSVTPTSTAVAGGRGRSKACARRHQSVVTTTRRKASMHWNSWMTLRLLAISSFFLPLWGLVRSFDVLEWSRAPGG